MNIDRTVMAFAGVVVMVGSALAYFVHPYWLAVPAFVGFNLFQSAFTRFCPLAKILKTVGLKSGNAFD